jgi:hypothetical protein
VSASLTKIVVEAFSAAWRRDVSMKMAERKMRESRTMHRKVAIDCTVIGPSFRPSAP